ncbi:MAG TPA: hypothetical protein VGO62_18730, partial [Myxococcota bacterium]
AQGVGDDGSEGAAVPLGADVAVVSEVGGDFHFLLFARTGAALQGTGTDLGTRAIPPDGAGIIGVEVDGSVAWFFDDDGIVYEIDSGSAPPQLGNVAEVNQKLALAVNGADVEGAVIHVGSTFTAFTDTTSFAAGGFATATPLPPGAFAFDNEQIERVVVRSADGARLDVGGAGFASYAQQHAAPQPLGACTRVASLVDFAAAPAGGDVWGATSTGAIVSWDAGDLASAAISNVVDAVGLTHQPSPYLVVAADASHALVGTSTGFSVAARNGDAVDHVDVDPGNLQHASAGFAVSGAQAVSFDEAGAGTLFGLGNPVGTEAPVLGSIGDDSTNTIGELVVAGDPAHTTSTTIAFAAAGNFSGAPKLLRCTVDIGSKALACNPPIDLQVAVTSVDPLSFGSLAFTADGGVVVLTSGGPSFVDSSDVVKAVNISVLASGEQPWGAGNGRALDLGHSCVAVFGFSNIVYAFDTSLPDLTLLASATAGLDPAASVAVLATPGHIVASGGNGGSFLAIDYDTSQTTCEAISASFSARVLGPARATSNITSAAFVDDDAWVGDDRGFLWHLPTFAP